MGQSGKTFLRRQLLSRGRKDKKALPDGSGSTRCKTLKVCVCEELPVAGRSRGWGSAGREEVLQRSQLRSPDLPKVYTPLAPMPCESLECSESWLMLEVGGQELWSGAGSGGAA